MASADVQVLKFLLAVCALVLLELAVVVLVGLVDSDAGGVSVANASALIDGSSKNVSLLRSGLSEFEMKQVVLSWAGQTFEPPHVDFETYQQWGAKTFDASCKGMSTEAPDPCMPCTPVDEPSALLFNRARDQRSRIIALEGPRLLDEHNVDIVVQVGRSSLLFRYLTAVFTFEQKMVVAMDICAGPPLAKYARCPTSGLTAGCHPRGDLLHTPTSRSAWRAAQNASSSAECTLSNGTVVRDPTAEGGLMTERQCFLKEHLDKLEASFTRSASVVAIGGFLVLTHIGLLLDTELIVAAVKQPKPLLPALFGQALLNPLMYFAACAFFDLNAPTILMSTLIAAAPGGGSSNVLTILSGGTLSISAAATLITTAFASFTMPTWLWIHRSIAGGIELQQFSVLPIIQLVLGMSLVSGFGVFLRMKLGDPRAERPTPAAKFVARFTKAVGFPLALCGACLYFFDNPVVTSAFELIDAKIVTLGVITQVGGLALGWGTSMAFRLPRIFHRTLAFEIGCQNLPLTLGVASYTFGSDPATLAEALPYFYAYFMLGLAIYLPFAVALGLCFPLEESEVSLASAIRPAPAAVVPRGANGDAVG